MTLFGRGKKITVNNPPASGVVGTPIKFDVDAAKAGKGSLEIEINGGSVPCTIQRGPNGQYHASFTPREAKQHVIQLKFNGQTMSKNVYTVDVRLRDRVTVTGPGVGRVPVNQVTSFTVRSENRTKLPVSVNITAPSGKNVKNCISDEGNGSSLVKYMPTEIGTYAIEVFCEGGRYSGPLSSEAFDIAAVTVRKVSKYTVGNKFEFQIDTSRAGDGALAVTILREVNRIEDDCVISHTMTGVNGLYSVTFTPSSRHPTYATILFNSTELPQSPVRLDSYYHHIDSEPTQQHPLPDTATTSGSSQNGSTSGQTAASSVALEDELWANDRYRPRPNGGTRARRNTATVSPVRRDSDCQAPPVRPEQSKARAFHADSKPIQQHTFPGTATTSGSSQNGSTLGDSSDEDSDAYVDMNQHRRSAVCDALQSCVDNGTQDVFISRNDIVPDVLHLYKDKDVATKQLSVKFLGEPKTSNESSILAMFRTFWMQVEKELFHGDKRLVPFLPRETARIDLWKFESLGRILAHTVALTGGLPLMLTRTVLNRLASDLNCDDEFLLDDFFHFVTPRERDLLTRAMSDFSGLTDEDYDSLRELYAAHGYHDIPKQSEIQEQVLNIAYQDLVATPGALISEMNHGIPACHKAAFWQRLSTDDITHILQRGD